MDEYRHRMTLVVPELFINQANNLALIVGESSNDINTFLHADWKDVDGNLYAVCSTAIKPIVLTTFGLNLADFPLRQHAVSADVEQAQFALDKVMLYSAGMPLSISNIYVAIDIEPLQFFNDLGLVSIHDENYEGS